MLDRTRQILEVAANLVEELDAEGAARRPLSLAVVKKGGNPYATRHRSIPLLPGYLDAELCVGHAAAELELVAAVREAEPLRALEPVVERAARDDDAARLARDGEA